MSLSAAWARVHQVCRGGGADRTSQGRWSGRGRSQRGCTRPRVRRGRDPGPLVPVVSCRALMRCYVDEV